MEGLWQTVRHYRATVIVGSVLLALGIAGTAWSIVTRAAPGPALVARVHDANGTVRELPLSEEGELTVTTALGTNVIRVEDGAARVVQADCPNGDCRRQRPVSRPGEQLICLPHRLWVEVVAAGDEGGQMDVGAVGGAGDSVDLVAGTP